MSKFKFVKLLSLFAAVATGLTMMLTGNVIEGVGVISASMASVSALSPKE